MTFEEMSFVTITGSEDRRKVDPWSPKVTGDHAADCLTGRACFAELQKVMAANQNPLFLSRVLHAQVKKGRWEGAEIGFCQAMAEQVM